MIGLVRCDRCNNHGGLPLWFYDDCKELMEQTGLSSEKILCINCRRELHQLKGIKDDSELPPRL